MEEELAGEGAVVAAEEEPSREGKEEPAGGSQIGGDSPVAD
jgi:hypothetical protein